MKINTALSNLDAIAHMKKDEHEVAPLVAGWNSLYTRDSSEGKIWTAIWALCGLYSSYYKEEIQLRRCIVDSAKTANQYWVENDITGKRCKEIKQINDLIAPIEAIDVSEIDQSLGENAVNNVKIVVDNLKALKSTCEKTIASLAPEEEAFRETVGPAASKLWDKKTFPILDHGVNLGNLLNKDPAIKKMIEEPFRNGTISATQLLLGKELVKDIQCYNRLMEFAYAVDRSVEPAELKAKLTNMLKITANGDYQRSVDIIVHVFEVMQARRAIKTSDFPSNDALAQLVNAVDNLKAIDAFFPVHRIIDYMDSITGLPVPYSIRIGKGIDEPHDLGDSMSITFWRWLHPEPNLRIKSNLNLDRCRQLDALYKPVEYLNKIISQELLPNASFSGTNNTVALRCLEALKQAGDKKAVLSDFIYDKQEDRLLTKLLQKDELSAKEEQAIPAHMAFLKSFKKEDFPNFEEDKSIFASVALRVLKPQTAEEAKAICEQFLSDTPDKDKMDFYLKQMTGIKLKAMLDGGTTQAWFDRFIHDELERGDPLLLHHELNLMPFPNGLNWEKSSLVPADQSILPFLANPKRVLPSETKELSAPDEGMGIKTALSNIKVLSSSNDPDLMTKGSSELVAGWNSIYTKASIMGTIWASVWTVLGTFSSDYNPQLLLQQRIRDSIAEINTFNKRHTYTSKSYKALNPLIKKLNSLETISIANLDKRYFDFAKLDVMGAYSTINKLKDFKTRHEEELPKLKDLEKTLEKTLGYAASAEWRKIPLDYNISLADAMKDSTLKTCALKPDGYRYVTTDGKPFPGIDDVYETIKYYHAIIQFTAAIKRSTTEDQLAESFEKIMEVNPDMNSERSVKIMANLFDFMQARRALKKNNADTENLEKLATAAKNLKEIDEFFPFQAVLRTMNNSPPDLPDMYAPKNKVWHIHWWIHPITNFGV